MCENDPWAVFISRDQQLRNVQILAEAVRRLDEPGDTDG